MECDIKKLLLNAAIVAIRNPIWAQVQEDYHHKIWEGCGLIEAANWSTENINVSGSASFLDSEQNDIDEIRRPEFLASATAAWNPIDVLALTLRADHNGEQLDTDFATFQNVELDSQTVVGANARLSVSDEVALTLRGTNLLNEDYQELVGYASPGRGIFARLGLDF